MQYTTHYNLMTPEGTDVVNPLVQYNPNFSDIDAAMFANKQGAVGSATELTAGTVHTITRANTDSNVIRFTATSNWTAGDNMVIDATPVSVFLSDGSVPVSGAYVINTEVLLILNGTRATLLTSDAKQDADEVYYDNAGSGLTASNVQDAIDEVKDLLDIVNTAVISDSGLTTVDDVALNAMAAWLNNRLQATRVVGGNGTYFVIGYRVSAGNGCCIVMKNTGANDGFYVVRIVAGSVANSHAI